MKTITKSKEKKENNELNLGEQTCLPFSEQVDLWNDNKWNKNSDLLMSKNTPQIMLNMGIDNNHITVTPNKIGQIVNGNKNHVGIGTEKTKKLFEQISNPLNIIESKTTENGIVVITALSDINDNIVIVPIEIDGYGRLSLITEKNIEKVFNLPSANAVTSAYGKSNYESWIKNNQENILYDKDDGIIKKRANGKWVQSPNNTNSSNHNIS